jgi:hypothetical protein
MVPSRWALVAAVHPQHDVEAAQQADVRDDTDLGAEGFDRCHAVGIVVEPAASGGIEPAFGTSLEDLQRYPVCSEGSARLLTAIRCNYVRSRAATVAPGMSVATSHQRHKDAQ